MRSNAGEWKNASDEALYFHANIIKNVKFRKIKICMYLRISNKIKAAY